MTIVPIRSGGVVPEIVMPPNEELIASLERMLEDAKSGHLRALVYALVDRNRAIHHGWTGKADHHDMAGQLPHPQ